jgi:hypothetical protein
VACCAISHLLSSTVSDSECLRNNRGIQSLYRGATQGLARLPVVAQTLTLKFKVYISNFLRFGHFLILGAHLRSRFRILNVFSLLPSAFYCRPKSYIPRKQLKTPCTVALMSTRFVESIRSAKNFPANSLEWRKSRPGNPCQANPRLAFRIGSRARDFGHMIGFHMFAP